MFHPSNPSPAHVPRIEANGPIRKVFLPDRWNPIHVLVDPDTGSPHNHPLSLVANILYGGYIETIWWPVPDGGYVVYHNVERLPGTSHRIDADTIHLITHLPAGISITEAEPTVADRDWFHFDPRPDGSIWRSKHHNGPWEPWHPAGPVEHLGQPTPAAAISPNTDLPKQNFIIGPGNTWAQAWEAMLLGHRVRRPHWHDTRNIFLVHILADGFLYPKPSLGLMLTTTTTPDLWRQTAVVKTMRADDLAAVDYVVLPDVNVEPITV